MGCRHTEYAGSVVSWLLVVDVWVVAGSGRGGRAAAANGYGRGGLEPCFGWWLYWYGLGSCAKRLDIDIFKLYYIDDAQRDVSTNVDDVSTCVVDTSLRRSSMAAFAPSSRVPRCPFWCGFEDGRAPFPSYVASHLWAGEMCRQAWRCVDTGV